MTNPLAVHIVDDDEAVRDSVRTVLSSAGYPCETYVSAGDFLARLGEVAGCALVDVRMPEMDGLALLAALSERRKDMPVIIMTGFADVPLAVKAMKAGAVDFVEKPSAREDLVGAVSRAIDRVRHAHATRDDQEAKVRLSRLTEREREVLGLLVEGDPNKIIAHKLGISPRTVEIHRSRLMEKVGAKSLAELVRLALAAGIGT